jgi:hypothetical protein
LAEQLIEKFIFLLDAFGPEAPKIPLEVILGIPVLLMGLKMEPVVFWNLVVHCDVTALCSRMPFLSSSP